MSTINTGYTTGNFYNPAAVTSAPTNFRPGQVQTDNGQVLLNNGQTPGGQTAPLATTATTIQPNNTGYTTPTRGTNLNITL